MTKEIKALEHIEKTISSIRCYEKVNISDDIDRCITIIKQALIQKSNDIENKNEPSNIAEAKGLLHNIVNGHFVKCEVCDVNWHKGCMCCIKHLRDSEEIKGVEQVLTTKSKKELAFDVIKEHFENQGSIDKLLTAIYVNATYDDYYESCREWLDNPISKEEFNLFKEVVKC